MTRLDRAIIAWAKGNRYGHEAEIRDLGYWFARGFMFCEGLPIGVRIKDMAGSPVLLILRSSLHAVTPEKHFRNKKWYAVSKNDFDRLVQLRAIIEQATARVKTIRSMNEMKPNIDLLREVGAGLLTLKGLAKSYGMDIHITDLEIGDSVILGAKYLLTGRCGAICFYNTDYERGYKLFANFDDALLMKMKQEGVTLHALDRA